LTKKKSEKRDAINIQRKEFIDEVEMVLVRIYKKQGCESNFSITTIHLYLKDIFEKFNIDDRKHYDAIKYVLDYIIRYRKKICFEEQNKKYVFVHLDLTSGSSPTFCFKYGGGDFITEFQKLQKIKKRL